MKLEKKRMIGFHIDMNIAQFQRGYLEKWLRQLAGWGYDSIIWEVENNIQWETCPECVSPDAFTKKEFCEILDLCRSLKLEPIPLFQTFGHCEYVLKHAKYRHLSESMDGINQYCPLKTEVREFLAKWIEEYLELFGKVNYFHLGADETWWLGKCEHCQTFVKEHSLAELYINHVNYVAGPLLEKGITPIIWADMVLTHPEAMSILDRRIMLFDWMYDNHHGQGKVWVWGKGFVKPEDLSSETLKHFGKYLYPNGDEPGREPETFFNSDALTDHGFRTVNCPGSSSYGDNVFSPRNYYHLVNTFDSFHKGKSSSMSGSVLTSWTVHLFPWELQQACIAMPEFIEKNPSASLEDYELYFVEKYFGVPNDHDFMKACGLLSKTCLFTYTASLGYGKSGLAVPPDHVEKTLKKIEEEGRLELELANSQKRLAEYEQAKDLFGIFRNKVSKTAMGVELLKWWELAARNLVNRAKASVWLIERALNKEVSETEGDAIMTQMQQLRDETQQKYSTMIKPHRLSEYMHWMYDAVARAMTEDE